MMIRPVEAAPATPVKPLQPGSRPVGPEKPNVANPHSANNEDQFLQELLMGAEALQGQQALAQNTVVLPKTDGGSAGLEEPRDFSKAPTAARREVASNVAPANRSPLSNISASVKQTLLNTPGLTDAPKSGVPTQAKAASVLAVPPQNEELRQILAEAFPEEQLARAEADGLEVVSAKASPAKPEVRDSEQFIALQSLPSQLKLKSLQTGERQKATYAQASAKPKAIDFASQLKAEPVTAQNVALPQIKKVKSADGNAASAPDTRIDLSQLEQVLGRGAASELVLSQPDQPQAKVLPRVQVDGHVTTGSMARERLSSESILGLRGAVNELQRQGGGEIQIRLKPEALGEIKLQVATRGSQVGIRIQAENPQAARVLEQSLDSLRDRLGEQNLKLGHIEFSSSPSSHLTPVIIGDAPVVDATPTWSQPVMPNSVSPNMADTGFASNNGRNSELAQDREDAIGASRGVGPNRGLRNQVSEHAGRINVLA